MRAAFASMAEFRARFDVAAEDGARLPVYEVGGGAAAPALLVGHANGLAAGSYEPWLHDLAAHFHVFAYDARGHGGSTWPDGPLETVFAVERFTADLAAVAAALVSRLGGAPLHFAGHSLAAAAAIGLALGRGASPFASQTLFEPPVFPPVDAPNYPEAIAQQTRLVRGSARRQARWASPEAMRDYLAIRGVFRSFRPEFLAAHCRATLRPDGDAFTLCCPPEVESTVFMGHRDADTWRHLPGIRAPLHLVSGDPDLPERDWVSGNMAALAARIPGAALTVLPGAGHMMICQQPERCRDLVLGRVAEGV
ncbi:MAG TPA: alpha/beta hydrolase [Stellaceae bacterium]|nr:alpha/beta hydrolase [Stellaceae bacterium]